MNVTLRSIFVVVAMLVCSITVSAHGRRQNFFFVEESWRLPPDTTLPGTSSTDVDLVDVDDDGDLDLFIAEGTDSPAPRPNRLLLNMRRGIFVDVSTTHLPPGQANSTKADFGDIDGDGDLDAIVANLGPEQLLINVGRGVANSRNEPIALYINRRGIFTARDFGAVPLPNETDTGLELVDLDEDGDLDVYVTNAGAFTMGHGFGGGPDRYFRNNGNARFAERTDRHFPGVSDPTTDAAFGDIDRDGDLDLVVGNSGETAEIGQERVFIQRSRSRRMHH
jgi:hypothetical protein